MGVNITYLEKISEFSKKRSAFTLDLDVQDLEIHHADGLKVL